MRPNIFSIATKELSQDGFFTWLIQWADNSNHEYDPELHIAAKDLIKYLIRKQYNYEKIEIKSVKTTRQWNKIDLLVEVDQNFIIIIEDKTNSSEHGDQLERYHQIASEFYKESPFKLVFIYLKTGNESYETLNTVKGKGYAIVDRKNVLQILENRNIKNEIFIEFKDYLLEIENQTNAYGTLQSLNSNWKAAEGFYVALQERIDDWTNWRYTSNQSGGFIGFWYHFTKTEYCSMYIQIENAINQNIKLVIKIQDWEPDVNLLYELLGELQPIADKNGLKLIKPDKFRTGSSSTVGIIENAFVVDSDGKLDIDKFVTTLKSLEDTINEYSLTY